MPSMTEGAAMTGPMTGPMILAEGLHKRFGANAVLKGVSLTLAKGEVEIKPRNAAVQFVKTESAIETVLALVKAG